jgi:AcrR family transcriptional regulator
MEFKIKRQIAISDARKKIILDGARRVLSRAGLEKASMREIAKEAGYTPGALYGYFASKQLILSELLDSVLESLTAAVAQKGPTKIPPEQVLGARGQAWISYLMEQPFDKQLLLHLYRAERPDKHGQVSILKIHERVLRTLEPLSQSMPLAALEPHLAAAELEAIWAHALGLLLSSEADPAPNSVLLVSERFANYLIRLSITLGGGDQVQAAAVETGVTQLDMFE